MVELNEAHVSEPAMPDALRAFWSTVRPPAPLLLANCCSWAGVRVAVTARGIPAKPTWKISHQVHKTFSLAICRKWINTLWRRVFKINCQRKLRTMRLHQTQMALLVPDDSLLCFWQKEMLSVLQNVTDFIWDRCCYITMCILPSRVPLGKVNCEEYR